MCPRAPRHYPWRPQTRADRQRNRDDIQRRADWCRFAPASITFIDPGSPWQNAYVESFNGKLRDELLATEQFHTLLEAKIMAEDCRREYNAYRPHSSLGYKTPDAFTLHWHHTNPELTKQLAH